MSPAILSTEEVASFRKEGYLLPHRQVFGPARFAELQAIFEEHLADKGDKLSDELDTPHFRDPRLLPFLLADEVLDLVEPIIGPDIALWSSHFISKDPFTGKPTPWHEDSAYWKGRLSGYDGIVTVWLALDRTSRENGCMRVIPGTHNNGFSEYEATAEQFFDREIKRDVDEARAVYFELEPGECSLHDGRIIHGAAANTSPRRRAGYTMRYFPTAIRMIPEANLGHRIWLARGRDLAGNVYANA
jgi:hypothetical protein